MIKDGFINIIKPTGMTSNDVVAKLRGIIKKNYGEKIKVGHTGTLDPNASGVMIVSVGRATKFSRYVIEKQKTYIAEILFGTITDTLDTYGKIEKTKNVSNHTQEEILEVLNSFLGKSMQIPPIYSALKVDGERLYKIARNEKEIPEIKSREIEISKINLLEKYEFKIKIEVECSSGTYIRSLSKDIGEKLGELATLSMLIRTQVDDFTIQDSFTIEEISSLCENKSLNRAVICIDDVLHKYSKIELKSGEKLYQNGAKIRTKKYLNKTLSNGIYRVYYRNIFMGIGVVSNEGDCYLKSETLMANRG